MKKIFSILILSVMLVSVMSTMTLKVQANDFVRKYDNFQGTPFEDSLEKMERDNQVMREYNAKLRVTDQQNSQNIKSKDALSLLLRFLAANTSRTYLRQIGIINLNDQNRLIVHATNYRNTGNQLRILGEQATTEYHPHHSTMSDEDKIFLEELGESRERLIKDATRAIKDSLSFNGYRALMDAVENRVKLRTKAIYNHNSAQKGEVQSVGSEESDEPLYWVYSDAWWEVTGEPTSNQIENFIENGGFVLNAIITVELNPKTDVHGVDTTLVVKKVDTTSNTETPVATTQTSDFYTGNGTTFSNNNSYTIPTDSDGLPVGPYKISGTVQGRCPIEFHWEEVFELGGWGTSMLRYDFSGAGVGYLKIYTHIHIPRSGCPSYCGRGAADHIEMRSNNPILRRVRFILPFGYYGCSPFGAWVSADTAFTCYDIWIN